MSYGVLCSSSRMSARCVVSLITTERKRLHTNVNVSAVLVTINGVVCNFQHIMFDCEASVQNRLTVITYLTDRILTVSYSEVLNSNGPLLICLVVSFLLESGFLI